MTSRVVFEGNEGRNGVRQKWTNLELAKARLRDVGDCKLRCEWGDGTVVYANRYERVLEEVIECVVSALVWTGREEESPRSYVGSL
jgi:hypothetical protein